MRKNRKRGFALVFGLMLLTLGMLVFQWPIRFELFDSPAMQAFGRVLLLVGGMSYIAFLVFHKPD